MNLEQLLQKVSPEELLALIQMLVSLPASELQKLVQTLQQLAQQNQQGQGQEVPQDQGSSNLFGSQQQ